MPHLQLAQWEVVRGELEAAKQAPVLRVIVTVQAGTATWEPHEDAEVPPGSELRVRESFVRTNQAQETKAWWVPPRPPQPPGLVKTAITGHVIKDGGILINNGVTWWWAGGGGQ